VAALVDGGWQFSHYEQFALVPVQGAPCAVDMPVVLHAGGAYRSCDVEARRWLGRQASSIFPAPPAGLLPCATHAEANAESRRLHGRGVSLQSFYLFAKIRQVQGVRGIVEAHPEMAFRARAGTVLPRKSTAEGYAARRRLLAPLDGLPTREEAQRMFRGAQADDILDAAVLADVAWRWSRGEAACVGGEDGARIWF